MHAEAFAKEYAAVKDEQQESTQQGEALPNVSTRLLRVVAAMVQETRPDRLGRVTMKCHLERDLGLDSLARVELLLRIGSEFEKSLPEEALSEAETPHDLLRFIARAETTDQESPTIAMDTPHAAIAVPWQAQTLVDVFEWHATNNPQRTHVVLYGETREFHTQPLSYKQLWDMAHRVATALVSRGLAPRQAVALMLPTGSDYLVSFFGVMLAGGIPVPIYPPARLAQIEDHLQRHARILANAEAVFIITVAQAKGVAALLRAKVPGLTEILSPADLDSDPMPLLYRAAPDDIAFLQYTSGSTGDPKGVMLSHANLLANLRAMGEVVEVSSDDIFVSWLPLYHDMGLIGAWFGALYFGMRLVLMSPLAFLARPVRWLRAIAQHRGTISAAPNFAYDLCARKLSDADLEGLDLSSWRLALNGAEPVSPATLRAFADRFAPFGLRAEALTPVYGLAESSVGLAFPPLARGPRIDRIQREALVSRRCALPASDNDSDAMCVPACGRVLPRHEIRIVDDVPCELPDRRIGRLQFRGPSATAGYFRNHAATQALFQGDWLDSGDFAYTVEGEIYLTGRVKDLIIRGGRNFYPYELEQAVGNIAGVRRGCVAVFGSNDPVTATERLVVVAETREEDSVLRADLCQKINAAALNVIDLPADEVVLAPPNTVLKTSSGKIRRAATREIFERGLLGVHAPPDRHQVLRLSMAALAANLREAMQRLFRSVYGGWCWAVFSVLAVPAALFVAVARSPHLARHCVSRTARAFLLLTGLSLPKMVAAELPARAHLLVVNHCSYLDALVLCAVLPPGCGYRFVAKREFSARPMMRMLLAGLGTLFVERFDTSKSIQDVQEIVTALQQGHKLVIFPEGTFSREAGLKPFRMGAFVAAARAQTPVLTSGLRGTRSVLRDRTWLPRHGLLAFELGALLVPNGEDWRAAVQLRDAARKEVLQRCGEHDLER